MTQWIIEATVRSTCRVDRSTAEVLAEALSACHGSARYEGFPGMSVQLRLEADTSALAATAGPALLATDVLPLLAGATLTDLRVVAARPSVVP